MFRTLLIPPPLLTVSLGVSSSLWDLCQHIVAFRGLINILPFHYRVGKGQTQARRFLCFFCSFLLLLLLLQLLFSTACASLSLKFFSRQMSPGHLFARFPEFIEESKLRASQFDALLTCLEQCDYFGAFCVVAVDSFPPGCFSLSLAHSL